MIPRPCCQRLFDPLLFIIHRRFVNQFQLLSQLKVDIFCITVGNISNIVTAYLADDFKYLKYVANLMLVNGQFHVKDFLIPNELFFNTEQCIFYLYPAI